MTQDRETTDLTLINSWMPPGMRAELEVARDGDALSFVLAIRQERDEGRVLVSQILMCEADGTVGAFVRRCENILRPLWRPTKEELDGRT